MARPVVVLPDPDSPTSPSVSSGQGEAHPSTACTVPIRRCKTTPRRIGSAPEGLPQPAKGAPPRPMTRRSRQQLLVDHPGVRVGGRRHSAEVRSYRRQEVRTHVLDWGPARTLMILRHRLIRGLVLDTYLEPPGQRGSNGHPAGGWAKSGGAPEIEVRRAAIGPSTRGTQPSRPTVQG